MSAAQMVVLMVDYVLMVVYVLKGHDFSRAVKRPEMSRALAPEGRLFFKFNPTAGHE